MAQNLNSNSSTDNNKTSDINGNAISAERNLIVAATSKYQSKQTEQNSSAEDTQNEDDLKQAANSQIDAIAESFVGACNDAAGLSSGATECVEKLTQARSDAAENTTRTNSAASFELSNKQSPIVRDATNETQNANANANSNNHLPQQNKVLDNPSAANHDPSNAHRQLLQRKHQVQGQSPGHNSNSSSTDAKIYTQEKPNNQAASVQQLQQEEAHNQSKCRRLSYVQVLFLRRWPFLAIAVGTMASLLFAIIISTFTLYLLQSASSGDCSRLAATLSQYAAAAGPGGPQSSLLSGGDFGLSRLELNAGFNRSPLHAKNVSTHGLQYSAQQSATQQASVLLPKSVEPLHYELYLQPQLLEPFVYSGRVAIQVRCLANGTRNITLHTNELELSESSLSLARQLTSNSSANNQDEKDAPKIVGLKHDKSLQFSIIELSDELQVGARYLLTIEFAGKHNDDLAGFYKIKYSDAAAADQGSRVT